MHCLADAYTTSPAARPPRRVPLLPEFIDSARRAPIGKGLPPVQVDFASGVEFVAFTDRAADSLAPEIGSRLFLSGKRLGNDALRRCGDDRVLRHPGRTDQLRRLRADRRIRELQGDA